MYHGQSSRLLYPSYNIAYGTYIAKEELNEDQKIAMEEMFESMAGMASSPVPQGGTDAGGGVDAAAEAVSAAMDFSMPEVSLDISV